MKRFFFVIVLLAVSISLVHAQDSSLTSNDPPFYCPNKNGAFYQANLFPRYDVATRSLLLIDATNNQSVRTLDTFDDNVRIINWSPDCRYLTGSVGEIRNGGYVDELGDFVEWDYHSTILWDSVNGGRINSVQDPGRYTDYVHKDPVNWSSDSNYALLLSGCPPIRTDCKYERNTYDFIWRRDTNAVYRVGGFSSETTQSGYNKRVYLRYEFGGSTFNELYWDMAHGWLWGSDVGGVSAFDVNTGIRAASFPNGKWTNARFIFSPDKMKVVVYSIKRAGDFEGGKLTVYDIASMTATPINVEGFSAPEIPLANYDPVALSADNRYLAVGYDAIRIWDIQNLPEKVEDRLPIYRHAGPKALIWSLRFSDAGVIETNSKEGIQHWDLHTGQFLPS